MEDVAADSETRYVLRPRTTSHKSHVTGCSLHVSGCSLHVSSCKSRVRYHLLFPLNYYYITVPTVQVYRCAGDELAGAYQRPMPASCMQIETMSSQFQPLVKYPLTLPVSNFTLITSST